MSESINDPSASACGKRNAYHHCCPEVGHYRAYATCLNLCDGTKTKTSEALYADCLFAINKKRCPALQMRKEELESHKAIYFVERSKWAGIAASAASFLGFTPSPVAAKPAPVKSVSSGKSSVIDRIDTADYSTAISAVAPVVAVEAKAGESILEMARRVLAQTQPK